MEKQSNKVKNILIGYMIVSILTQLLIILFSDKTTTKTMLLLFVFILSIFSVALFVFGKYHYIEETLFRRDKFKIYFEKAELSFSSIISLTFLTATNIAYICVLVSK